MRLQKKNTAASQRWSGNAVAARAAHLQPDKYNTEMTLAVFVPEPGVKALDGSLKRIRVTVKHLQRFLWGPGSAYEGSQADFSLPVFPSSPPPESNAARPG